MFFPHNHLHNIACRWYYIGAMYITTKQIEYFVLHLAPLFVVYIANWGVGHSIQKETPAF